MRILFLSEIPSILLCIALWFVIQAGGAALCSMLPARIFHPQACPFRPFAFEDGGTRVIHYTPEHFDLT